MRATIAIDDALFEEAFSLSNVETKKELISLTLQEFIRPENQIIDKMEKQFGRDKSATHI